ncbi:hypothetical protein RND81_09G105800 [Saponaria officinalis]|uniref:Uncharacterized protein n=1 Tax=Saponaria officinalis TaxID=3572 RepID=A0AAW1ILA0_SAPOF
MNLHVKYSKVLSTLGLCRFFAFVDTYNGLSQIIESNRSEYSKRFFGGVVGQKLSTDQLQEVAPEDLLEIVEAMKGMGVTTSHEHNHVDRIVKIQDGRKCKITLPSKRKITVPLTEKELKGTTRHTIANEVVYLPHEIDPIRKAIDAEPVYAAFEAKSVQIIAEENGFLRRYTADEKEGVKLSRHAVMGIGRGACYNKKTGKEVEYVVGQNNLPGDANEICRCSFDSIRIILSFNVRPIP